MGLMKFLYRLGRCPELTLGLFTLPILQEGQAKPRPTLVGHVVATRTSGPRVTDASMLLPPKWQTERMTIENGETLGHDEYGATIVIHSLAVLPEHQGKQVASTLMKAYIQRIKEAAIAERIALISHDNLIPFYESLGFENTGPSNCKFGGGGWYDLVSPHFRFHPWASMLTISGYGVYSRINTCCLILHPLGMDMMLLDCI